MAYKKDKEQLIEVCRSFSYKMSLPHYENVDFFCSQKSEVPESEAEKKSEILYEFCKSEVIKSVNKYKEENLIVKSIEKLKAVDFAIAKETAPEAQFVADKAEEMATQEKIAEDNKEIEEALPIINPDNL